MPEPLSKRVRVRHVSGAEKDVLRTKLDQLGPRWKRVSNRANRRLPTPPEDVTEETPETPDGDK